MNKLITHKITLALFFVIVCQFTLKAQDTSKVILVVRPGQTADNTNKSIAANSAPVNAKQQYHATPPPPAVTIIPTRTAIYSTATDEPISMSSKNALAHTANNTVPAAVVNTPAKTGASTTAGVSVPVKAPSVGVGISAPFVQKQNASGGIAPTTSERTGMPTYLTTPPKNGVTARTGTPTGVTTVVKPSATGNTTGAPVTSAPVITSPVVATTPVFTPPAAATTDKKDTVIAKKDTVVKTDSLLAKKDTTKKDTLIAKKDTSNTDSLNEEFAIKRIAFLEIGGPGLAISANYDMRVKIGNSDRFGFRAGAGYFQSGNNWVFTVPLQANYLYGKDGKYLEFGLGTTFLISRGDNYSSKNFIFDNDTGFIATGTIGFRYQPTNGKINFRLGYVPIIDDEGFVSAGGFSVGYTF